MNRLFPENCDNFTALFIDTCVLASTESIDPNIQPLWQISSDRDITIERVSSGSFGFMGDPNPYHCSVCVDIPLSLRAVQKRGRILTVGDTGNPKFEFDNRYIFGKHLSLIGSSVRNKNDFKTVMDLVIAGKLKPVLDETFPLKKAQAAHARIGRGEHLSKITLSTG